MSNLKRHHLAGLLILAIGVLGIAGCHHPCDDDDDCHFGLVCIGSSVCPDDVVCVWEGEPGVGTNRIVKVGPMEIKEHFVIWREPFQMAFYISETSLPFAKRMVENYTIEETSTGSRFTYAVGMEVRFPLSVVKFAAKPKLEKMFHDAVVSFEKYMNQ